MAERLVCRLMRVITGTARGRKLQTLDGFDVRPTTEVVKEAVFSVIQFVVFGSSVLDLFAGSGQMGIEALSRGAQKVTFVDNFRPSQEIIKQNLLSTGFTKQAKVLAEEAALFLAHAVEKYDIIFLDPPYNQGYADKLLPLLGKPLSDDGFILFEHE
ncbi:MAG: 16S rRNA (guanine(966)-N(2))-methyltransferase RsmD, partial [Oscillospiraceae bacterium]